MKLYTILLKDFLKKKFIHQKLFLSNSLFCVLIFNVSVSSVFQSSRSFLLKITPCYITIITQKKFIIFVFLVIHQLSFGSNLLFQLAWTIPLSKSTAGLFICGSNIYNLLTVFLTSHLGILHHTQYINMIVKHFPTSDITLRNQEAFVKYCHKIFYTKLSFIKSLP